MRSRIVLCKICRNDTFRLVVPDPLPRGTVRSVTECTRCGEENVSFGPEDTRMLTPATEKK
jgi:hypothetical protein